MLGAPPHRSSLVRAAEGLGQGGDEAAARTQVWTGLPSPDRVPAPRSDRVHGRKRTLTSLHPLVLFGGGLAPGPAVGQEARDGQGAAAGDSWGGGGLQRERVLCSQELQLPAAPAKPHFSPQLLILPPELSGQRQPSPSVTQREVHSPVGRAHVPQGPVRHGQGRGRLLPGEQRGPAHFQQPAALPHLRPVQGLPAGPDGGHGFPSHWGALSSGFHSNKPGPARLLPGSPQFACERERAETGG
uniref:Uncharacterized protein n=1 Tax=Oryctolagus cuniculus TaxID=9986 RepID=G1U1Z9_RABIT